MLAHMSVYPATFCAIDWLSHNLEAVEESSYHFYRRIRSLTKVVDDAERGETSRMVAEAVIRKYNERSGTCLSYDEVRTRTSDLFLLADYGEWVCYTDNPEALLKGEGDTLEEIVKKSGQSLDWAVLYQPDGDFIAVIKSPHVGGRREQLEELEDVVAIGMQKGELPAFLLPPSIEGSIKQDLDHALSPR